MAGLSHGEADEAARVHQAVRRRGGAWPRAARAQQAERMRRVGVLSTIPTDDPEATARTAAFLQTLQELGWSDGRNVRIDIRWSAGSDTERIRKYAMELVALAPDVLLTNGIGGGRARAQTR